MEAQNEGSGLRAFAFLGVCGLLVFLGFRALNADHALLGLALFVAGPILWVIVESNIKKQAAERVWQEENLAAIPPQQTVAAPERAGTQDDGSGGIDSLSSIFSAGDFRLGYSAIRDGESLTEWCERTAEAFPAISTVSKQEVRELLVAAVKHRKPRAGEPVAVWYEETTARIREVSRLASTDLHGPESGRQPDESNLEWLRRVAPLFLNVNDGESKDDVIDALVGIADQAPPNKGESVMAWCQRVRPLIDEYNARQDEPT
jgi:hypothetical protein